MTEIPLGAFQHSTRRTGAPLLGAFRRFTVCTGAPYPIRDQKGAPIDSTSWNGDSQNRKNRKSRPSVRPPIV